MHMPAAETPSEQRGEFRRGWPAMVAAFCGIGLGLGPLPVYTIAIFLPHLTGTFGWTRSQIMGALLVQTAAVMLSGPFFGRWADRFGVRPVGLVSLILFSLAFASLALSAGNITLFYIQWGIMALFGCGTMPMIWIRSVNSAFDRHKGVAIALANMGTGVCSLLAKPYAAWAVDAYGWRLGYVAVAALPLVIAAPAAALLLRSGKGEATHSVAGAAVGFTVGEALRDWRFWILTVHCMLLTLAFAGAVPNLEGIMTAHGEPKAAVLEIVAYYGVGLIVSRLICGYLLDLIWAPLAGCLLLLLCAAGVFLLSTAETQAMASASVFLIGLGTGLQYILIVYIISRYFGGAHFAAISGTLNSLYYWSLGVGPLGYSLTFDHFGSYTIALRTAAACVALAGVILLALGRYRFPGARRS